MSDSPDEREENSSAGGSEEFRDFVIPIQVRSGKEAVLRGRMRTKLDDRAREEIVKILAGALVADVVKHPNLVEGDKLAAKPGTKTAEEGSLSHLRRKPGRPRKNAPVEDSARQSDSVKLSATEARFASPVLARLFDLEQTAAYLGVSPWTVRGLETAGTLKRVCVPFPGGRILRKLLFDKSDLDRLIEMWKEGV